jgi:hypothetical protein
VPIQFLGKKIVLAGKGIYALDALTLAPLWTAKKLDWIYDLVVGEEVIFASGKKGVVALDESSGEILWRVEAEKGATNLVWFEEENLLVFSDNTGLVMVNGSSGEIVRRRSLDLEERIVFLRKVGLDFLLVSTGKDVALLEREAWEPIWKDTAPDAALAPVDYLVTYPRPKLGSAGMWGELGVKKPGFWSGLWSGQSGVATFQPREQTERQLRGAWDMLRQQAEGHAPAQTLLERLQTGIEGGSERMPVYATEVAKDTWKLWRIDSSTGGREEWFVNGSQPDVIEGFGLAYIVSGDTLRAVRLTASASTD